MKVIIYLFCIAMFFSCNSKNETKRKKNDSVEVSENPKDRNLIFKKLYDLNLEPLKLDITDGQYPTKAVVRIELQEKLEEYDLKLKSLDVRDVLGAFDNVYIFYTLKGDKSDYGWAYCHFNPNIDFEITGSKIEDDKKVLVQSRKSERGSIVGKWKSEGSLSGAIIILSKEKSKMFMTINFVGESDLKEEVVVKNIGGARAYTSNNEFGEYYIIENNGNLGMYGENGKFDEAKKIND